MPGETPDAGVDDLGECLHVFKPSPANAVAGFILSVGLTVGGAAAILFPLRGAYFAGWNLPWDAKQGWCWYAVGLLCLVGFGLTVGGIGLAMLSRFLLSHRVEFCTNGLRYFSRRTVERVTWADVTLIREVVLYERPPLLKGPARLLLPKFASTRYEVLTTGGKELAFNGNSIKAIRQFGEMLRETAERLCLRWEKSEEHG